MTARSRRSRSNLRVPSSIDLGNVCFTPEAVVRVILVKRSANDPKRPYRPVALQHKSWAKLTDDGDLGHT